MILWDKTDSGETRAVALAGLVKAGPEAALPLVVQAIRSDDPFLRGTAASLVRKMTLPGVSAALATALEAAEPPAQAVILEVLAARGGRAAGPAVAKLMDS
ncbi:MAG: hypothetical protein NT049_04390, partial [Planctomycetota bacterium]|nr:hypothetical protein [Planctomycetota bacterium]